jgi:hypothetical protein
LPTRSLVSCAGCASCGLEAPSGAGRSPYQSEPLIKTAKATTAHGPLSPDRGELRADWGRVRRRVVRSARCCHPASLAPAARCAADRSRVRVAVCRRGGGRVGLFLMEVVVCIPKSPYETGRYFAVGRTNCLHSGMFGVGRGRRQTVTSGKVGGTFAVRVVLCKRPANRRWAPPGR